MGNADRKWPAPALIALAAAASVVVNQSLPARVDPRLDELLPFGTLAPAQPVAREILAFGVLALAVVVWGAFRLFRAAFGQRLGRVLYRNVPPAVTTTEQFDRFGSTYEAIVLAVVMLLLGIHATVLSAALQHPTLAARILGSSFGVALIVMGNVMPRLRPNWVAGLRTRRTLNDPELWRSAHRAFGRALVVSGLITVAVAIVAPRYGFVAGLALLIAALIAGAIAATRHGDRVIASVA
jgi:hypothetical protein